jgi:hypothetical protein
VTARHLLYFKDTPQGRTLRRFFCLLRAPQNMNKTDTSRNTDIEVLRAVAISFTLCAHLIWGLLPKIGSLGLKLQSMLRFWTGVDLFFGISGFIITCSLIEIMQDENLADGTARPRGWRDFLEVAVPFWIRRVFRLLPSAWLWILITLLLATTFNFHTSFGTLRDNLHEAGAAVLNFIITNGSPKIIRITARLASSGACRLRSNSIWCCPSFCFLSVGNSWCRRSWPLFLPRCFFPVPTDLTRITRHYYGL